MGFGDEFRVEGLTEGSMVSGHAPRERSGSYQYGAPRSRSPSVDQLSDAPSVESQASNQSRQGRRRSTVTKSSNPKNRSPSRVERGRSPSVFGGGRASISSEVGGPRQAAVQQRSGAPLRQRRNPKKAESRRVGSSEEANEQENEVETTEDLACLQSASGFVVDPSMVQEEVSRLRDEGSYLSRVPMYHPGPDKKKSMESGIVNMQVRLAYDKMAGNFDDILITSLDEDDGGVIWTVINEEMLPMYCAFAVFNVTLVHRKNNRVRLVSVNKFTVNIPTLEELKRVMQVSGHFDELHMFTRDTEHGAVVPLTRKDKITETVLEDASTTPKALKVLRTYVCDSMFLSKEKILVNNFIRRLLQSKYGDIKASRKSVFQEHIKRFFEFIYEYPCIVGSPFIMEKVGIDAQTLGLRTEMLQEEGFFDVFQEAVEILQGQTGHSRMFDAAGQICAVKLVNVLRQRHEEHGHTCMGTHALQELGLDSGANTLKTSCALLGNPLLVDINHDRVGLSFILENEVKFQRLVKMNPSVDFCVMDARLWDDQRAPLRYVNRLHKNEKLVMIMPERLIERSKQVETRMNMKFESPSSFTKKAATTFLGCSVAYFRSCSELTLPDVNRAIQKLIAEVNVSAIYFLGDAFATPTRQNQWFSDLCKPASYIMPNFRLMRSIENEEFKFASIPVVEACKDLRLFEAPLSRSLAEQAKQLEEFVRFNPVQDSPALVYGANFEEVLESLEGRDPWSYHVFVHDIPCDEWMAIKSKAQGAKGRRRYIRPGRLAWGKGRLVEILKMFQGPVEVDTWEEGVNFQVREGPTKPDYPMLDKDILPFISLSLSDGRSRIHTAETAVVYLPGDTPGVRMTCLQDLYPIMSKATKQIVMVGGLKHWAYALSFFQRLQTGLAELMSTSNTNIPVSARSSPEPKLMVEMANKKPNNRRAARSTDARIEMTNKSTTKQQHRGNHKSEFMKGL